jgi:hypothetical protein
MYLKAKYLACLPTAWNHRHKFSTAHIEKILHGQEKGLSMTKIQRNIQDRGSVCIATIKIAVACRKEDGLFLVISVKMTTALNSIRQQTSEFVLQENGVRLQ